MAHKIDPDACVACGSCIDECPLGAISAGDVYSVFPAGFFILYRLSHENYPFMDIRNSSLLTVPSSCFFMNSMASTLVMSAR